jgi:flagellar hook protein FlgE
MSFQQGLSGLNAASKQLEVIGNNVANANTIGFKQSRAEFADVFANSLTGGGGVQIGIGTKLAAVAQQFTQGNISSSNNSLDIAINGGGFFQLSTSVADKTASYSRNGQFHVDQNGYIVNAENKNLNGWPADATGSLQKGSVAPLRLSTDELVPKATTAVTGIVNLDSRKPIFPGTNVFNPTDPTTYTDSTATTVYDSLGNQHTLQTFFVKSAANTWDVYNTADGVFVTGTSASTPTTTLTFNGTGINPTSSSLVNPTPISFAPLSGGVATGATNPVALTVDYTSSTQFGATFSINDLTQDGYTSGRLAGFNTGADGTIVGRYTNGQSKTLGQVTLVHFKNPNGLQSLGGNVWSETATSGKLDASAPGTGQLGVLQSSALEESNVDMTAELVNMITAQRLYQANAQTIKTQDQVLQTLVNLR